MELATTQLPCSVLAPMSVIWPVCPTRSRPNSRPVSRTWYSFILLLESEVAIWSRAVLQQFQAQWRTYDFQLIVGCWTDSLVGWCNFPPWEFARG